MIKKILDMLAIAKHQKKKAPKGIREAYKQNKREVWESRKQ